MSTDAREPLTPVKYQHQCMSEAEARAAEDRERELRELERLMQPSYGR